MEKLDDDQAAADTEAQDKKDEIQVDQAEDDAHAEEDAGEPEAEVRPGSKELGYAVQDQHLGNFAKIVRGSELPLNDMVNELMASKPDARALATMLVRAAKATKK